MDIYQYNSKPVYLSSDFVYRIKAYSRGKKKNICMNFPIEENKKMVTFPRWLIGLISKYWDFFPSFKSSRRLNFFMSLWSAESIGVGGKW